ncbi:Elongator complex protein 5 [Podospora fimiseda]|uniref:Elongator complex protein 5 n=1 Tax=Podospora fimiseda TaxID=252190 RepID=A0AAN7BVJ6_9PEZI|nr:Elongator complex protein 5 [Podospora fimiseda]
MAPSAQAHHRSHSLLLLQKLLNLRDTASPLTFILDTLEQPAKPLLQEFTTRAKISKAKIVLVSFSTVHKPPQVDIFIKARKFPKLKDLAIEIASHVAPPSSTTASNNPPTQQKNLIIIDNINNLINHSSPSEIRYLPTFFQYIIPPSTTSLIAVYHTDIPYIHAHSQSPYSPQPLTVLTHIATAILKVSNLWQAAETKQYLDKSKVPPQYGLNEGIPGIAFGLRPEKMDPRLRGGIVVDMELRRKSGRIVQEKFVVYCGEEGKAQLGRLMLMSDHPVFAPATAEPEEENEMEASFNLGLTEKQRRDREGVVLPYFDAQTEVGGGEGGRILYDIGSEDDFDEEEDEI